MIRFALVCLGGAIGSGARYLASMAFVPYGTLVVNLVGSFVMGAAIEFLRPGDLRVFVAAGILGGFTTYSSFNEETLLLMRTGEWGTATMNVAATLVGCFVAGAAGLWVARALRG